MEDQNGGFLLHFGQFGPQPSPKPVEGWVLVHRALGGTVHFKGQEWLGCGGKFLMGIL